MKTFNLYNGSVTLDFHENGHKYQVTENGVTTTPTGATTILRVLNKPALMTWPLNECIKALGGTWSDDEKGWVVSEKTLTSELLNQAAKAYTRKSDKGMDTGKEVHAWIEQFLITGVGGAPTPSLEAQKACLAFVDWFESQNIKVLATEQPVYSRKYGYAGTFDALLEIDGKVVLVDIKTTNVSRTAPLGIYPENFLQLGAYSLAHTEESGQVVDDLMIINASKTGKLSTLRASEIGLSVKDCESSFLDCLKLFNMMNTLGERLK